MKESTQGIRVISVNNSEDIWQRFLKNEKGPFDSKGIKKETITKMANLLFNDLTEKQITKFEKMVKFEYSWHKSVCIWYSNPVYFERFCREYEFEDIGRKEVVLQSDGNTILFTNDFKKMPE